MEIVINAAFGGFQIPEELIEKIGAGWAWNDREEIRTNPTLIEWVKANLPKTELGVAFVPDDATDYTILEYDGLESILYVQDGKLYYADTVS